VGHRTLGRDGLVRRAHLRLVVGSCHRVNHRVRRTPVTRRQGREKLLGERFCRILVTDRWSAYHWYPIRWQQVCWAHLLWDFEAMIELGGRSQKIATALLEQARQMFHGWQRGRAAILPHAQCRVLMRPIQRQGARWLKAGQTCGAPKTEGVCRKVLKVFNALWTFVRVEEVEPTNNAAERAIRLGVLWCKSSYGAQSADGS
jgi:transposase